LVTDFVATVDHQTLLNLVVDFSSLCNQKAVAARVLQPGKTQVIEYFDVSLLQQILRIKLAEHIRLVDELYEFRRELRVIVLSYGVDRAILTEQPIMLIHFSLTAETFAQTIALRSTQYFKEESGVLGVFKAFLSRLLLHVEQLGQTLFDV
jgi:hypothetical protein